MTEEQKNRFAAALLRVAGDCELLAAMASMVAEDAPEVLNNLRDQIALQDTQQVASTAHKLKGMLSTFETAGPMLELEELISSAKKGHPKDVASHFAAVEGEIEVLLNEICLLHRASSNSD